MSFWNTTEGDKVENSGNYEVSTGIEPMPEGTDAISMPTEAKWDEYQGRRHIKIRWDVVDGPYKNRWVPQKLWVLGNNPNLDNDKDKQRKQADKHKRMLAAIDANAGGKLFANDGEPTDMQLASALCNKPMMVKYGVWKDSQTDEPKGNWVMAVQGRVSQQQKQAASKETQQKVDDFDDDIPF